MKPNVFKDLASRICEHGDHLWLGLLWAVLEGLSGYHALARLLATRALDRFAPVSVMGSAVLQVLRLHLAEQAGCDPFARHVPRAVAICVRHATVSTG